jgi:hypothetical protein
MIGKRYFTMLLIQLHVELLRNGVAPGQFVVSPVYSPVVDSPALMPRMGREPTNTSPVWP